MATYYVDPSGSHGSGTEGSPFNVLPANFSSAGYVNDDVFLLKRGTTYTPAWSGVDGDAFTVNRRIAFGAYGSGAKPIVQSAFTGSGNGKLFRIYVTGTTFSDIEISDTSGVHAIYVQSALVDFSVNNCDFYNIRGDDTQRQNAIVVGASGALTGTVSIKNCRFNNICNDAIYVVCTGTVDIRNNDIRNVSVDATTGDCIQVSGNCARLLVINNYCDKTNRDTKQCIIQDGGATGYAHIEGNTFNGYFGSDSANHTAVYMTLPCLITRNVIKSWRSGVALFTAGQSVTNNLIIQGGGSANTGAVWGAAAGMVVNGNTIIRTDGTELSDAAIRNNSSDASNIYKNNVIVGFGRGIRKGALAVESNNAFWQVGNPVIDASAVTVTPHASDLTSDPMLSASYRPQSGSPLLGAGTHLGYRRDLDGKQRPNPPSIGAYDGAPMKAD